MRILSGCILIHAACVLLSAIWLGNVIHKPVVVGTPEAFYLLAAAVFLGVFGGAIVALSLLAEIASSQKQADLGRNRTLIG